jgi:hypothetical protein
MRKSLRDQYQKEFAHVGAQSHFVNSVLIQQQGTDRLLVFTHRKKLPDAGAERVQPKKDPRLAVQEDRLAIEFSDHNRVIGDICSAQLRLSCHFPAAAMDAQPATAVGLVRY